MSHAAETTATLESFIAELPPFSGTGMIRNAARDRRAVLDAALDYLERRWLHGRRDGNDHSAIALLAVSSSDEHMKRFADDVLFRVPDQIGYRALAPLLRNLVDDAGFARLLVDALDRGDDDVAAHALDLQYHGYGFPDRFTVSPDDAARIAASVEALRPRAEPGGALADALARYTPPHP